jgi:transposase-like protein
MMMGLPIVRRLKCARSAGTKGALDERHWTTERKVALVREILSGKVTRAAAAREFPLSEDTIEGWLEQAERGIAAALANRDPGSTRDPEKLRTLARAYKRLKAENRELKAGTQQRSSVTKL